MVHVLRALVFCTPILALCAQPAGASDAGWHVVLSSSNPGISLPQLPTEHSFLGAGLSDSGAGLLGFQLSAYGGGIDGNWFERGSILAQYAKLGVTGALGPGRVGAESTHVFRSLYYGDSSGDGTRAFGATANDPANSASAASTSVWLWDGTKNVEIARVGVEGALGPDLGNGAIYTSLHHVNDTSNNVNVWMLPNRRVLFAGRIGTASTSGSDGLSMYTPGAGNHACMLSGTTDANFGPGVANGVFDFYTGMSANKTISPRGEVYAMGSIDPTSGGPPGWYGSNGIWQFCDGAPKLAVLTHFTGQYGPGFPGDNAVFGGDSNGLYGFVAPSLPGSFYFSSGGLTSTASGAPSFFGLFHHDGALVLNRPILLDNSEGAYGPQIAGQVFHTNVVPYNIRAAGKYAALLTTISPVGQLSSTNNGLWRIAAEGTLQPVAITGDTGAYAPAPGRIWNGTYYKFTVFDNGDIVVLADTKTVANSSIAVSWWRLRHGTAPVEILKVGDLVQVPTPGGIVSKPVTAINPPYVVGLPAAAGRDTWFTANGNILTTDIKIQGFETTSVAVRGLGTRSDYIFATGND